MYETHTKRYFHDVSTEHLLKELNTYELGLDDLEAATRLDLYGRNVLPTSESFSAIKLFFKQFQNPLIFILLFAMVLSFVIQHYSDGVIIAVVVLVTNLVGFIQEYKANNALQKLNEIVQFRSKVVRNGTVLIVDQSEIVPGDILEIRAGDIVPADARLIFSQNLEIIEATLTGEALPSPKHTGDLATDTVLAERNNMVYRGTLVSDGIGRAVVVATGVATEIGKITDSLQGQEDTVTPLQKQLNHFGKWLSIFLIATNALIFMIGIVLGRPFFEMFMVSVVVVVSAVPEGMIPAMTIVLALGMQKLIRKKGLVRKIISAETLGSVSVICTDKTGTLTEGIMSVDSIFTFSCKQQTTQHGTFAYLDHAARLAVKIGVISNNAIRSTNTDNSGVVVGNMTEQALLTAGARNGLVREDLEMHEKRIDEIPFNSASKIMATLHAGDSENSIYVKGAPERIISRASGYLHDETRKPFDDGARDEVYKQIDTFTRKGQRVLAIAYKKTSNTTLTEEDIADLVFVGLLSIKDRPREDAKDAIALCHTAGIRVVMITGDHANTAAAIAREMGIPVESEQILEGKELEEMSDKVLANKVRQVTVFARVEPRHKLRIVELLQSNGEVVAMTGDGINDAPALKKANIGVVMGNGSDVAKEVADLVLLDNRFMTIVSAVKQGRITFENIRKVVVYLFTDCFQEMVIIGSAILFRWPLPILPVQILWIKLIESPLPATSLAFDESENDVLQDKPRSPNEFILTKHIKLNIAFYAVVMDIFALTLFWWYWQGSGNVTKAQTVLFAALGMSTLFNIYNVRSLGKSVFRTKPFKNKVIVVSTVVGFLLFLVSIYIPYMNTILHTTPLTLTDWGVIAVYAVLSLVVFDIGKRLTKFMT